jgi:hypothetical protein
MAKADGNYTTTWIPLFDARALVVKAFGAMQLAERLLKQWLGEGRVRWRCKRFEPARLSDLAALQKCLPVAKTAYSGGDPAFWRIDLEINWEEGSAREKYVHGGNRAYVIMVVREDLLALLPPDDIDGDDTLAKVWAPRVARELKRAGKLDGVTKKIELARRIIAAGVAAGRDKAGEDYIRDNVEALGIWPIAKIK